jgi:uncharacterized protein YdhG (YjbR/CyaY superfamily)
VTGPDITTKRKGAAGASTNVWTDVERAAMQESARERKSRAKLTPEQEREAGEQEVQAKIAELPEPDRSMAARIHELVLESVPDLMPRTYYGMPAYAKNGKTICFFQPASKFKVRYSTFGFQPDAKIDDGELWPVAYAVTKITPAVEKEIAGLVKKAVS